MSQFKRLTQLTPLVHFRFDLVVRSFWQEVEPTPPKESEKARGLYILFVGQLA